MSELHSAMALSCQHTCYDTFPPLLHQDSPASASATLHSGLAYHRPNPTLPPGTYSTASGGTCNSTGLLTGCLKTRPAQSSIAEIDACGPGPPALRHTSYRIQWSHEPTHALHPKDDCP